MSGRGQKQWTAVSEGTRDGMSFRRTAGRLLYLLLVLWGISLGTFSLLSMIPGDPAEIILRQQVEAPTPQQIQALRRQMGWDAPFVWRYLRWLTTIFKSGWGVSWRTGRPVWQEIGQCLGPTVELALCAFALAVIISTICGVWAAIGRHRLPDHLVRAAAILFSALPPYWLGLLLIYLFSIKAAIFPVSGHGEAGHLVLPAVTLGMTVAMLQARVLRAALIEIMAADYIRFAVAQGLSAREIFFGHILRNALPPMLTVWGVCLGQLMGGAVIVEALFAWPGLGQLTLEAVSSRDIPVIQAIVMLLAMIFVGINQATELIHGRLDPKVGRA